MAKKIKLEVIHAEALERFENVSTAENDQRTKAIEDANFAHSEDGQWEDSAKEKRRDRPRYTLNRVAGALDQVNGDQRQNRTQIKVRPRTGGTKDIAKIKMGLSRSIENKSDAESIYDAAFDETITSGYGGWRLLTQFSGDSSFDQEIVIAPVKSAASSMYFDTSAEKYDKRDALWAFYIKDVDTSVFKRDYPGAAVTDFSDAMYYAGSCNGWFRQNKVRIAEYWKVELVDAEIGLMSDGRTLNLTEEKDVIDELAAQTPAITVLKRRKTKIRKVQSYIMNGAEILEGPMDWAGKYIPLVPVYGRTYNIEGKEHIRGMVRIAKDPQRIYNYATSTAIEATALAPKDPIWITAKQALGHEDKLKSFNTTNSPFMLYNTDAEAPGAPQRTGAPAVQQALLQQQSQASMDIYAATGIQPPSLGINPEMQSGKAIIAQQKMGDRSTFVFSDNLHKSIKYTGDILEDLMPRIYDTQRIVTILNFDGSTEDVKINAEAVSNFNETILDEETGEPVIVNDLSVGEYETYIEAGPAYNTLREESAQQLIELVSASPRFEALAMDMIAKNLNILESEELTKRLRKQMINEGAIQPTEEEIEELGLNQPQPPSEEQEALLENIRFQTVRMMADTEKINAETDKVDAQTLDTKMLSAKRSIEAYKLLMDSYKIQLDTGIDLGINEDMLKKAQQGIVSLNQEELVSETVEASVQQQAAIPQGAPGQSQRVPGPTPITALPVPPQQ